MTGDGAVIHTGEQVSMPFKVLIVKPGSANL